MKNLNRKIDLHNKEYDTDIVILDKDFNQKEIIVMGKVIK
jgi:N-acetylglucosamine-6-phosphate deacetylase